MKTLLLSILFSIHLACTVVSVNGQELQYPLDVAVAKDGSVFIADLKLPGIWKYQDRTLSVVYKADPKLRSPLNAVRCVAVDDEGNLFAGDSATREIYRVNGLEDITPLTGGNVGVPVDLAIRESTLYVADLEYRQIVRIPIQGGKPDAMAKNLIVRGLTIAEEDSLFFVGNTQLPLGRINASGEVSRLIEGEPFQFAHQLALLNDTLYITDNYASTIWKCGTEAGSVPEVFVSGEPLVRPVGLCTDGEQFFVADPRARDVFVISAEGMIQSLFADSPAE